MCGERQKDGESGAFAGLAFDRDTAVVAVDDPLSQAEPESHTFDP
jgi:hypothetical protein